MFRDAHVILAECDRCHRDEQVREIVLGQAGEYVKPPLPEGWREVDGKHYCPRCERVFPLPEEPRPLT